MSTRNGSKAQFGPPPATAAIQFRPFRIGAEISACNRTYYEWGHVRAGNLVHRQISAGHAATLRHAISNYRLASKLLRDWE